MCSKISIFSSSRKGPANNFTLSWTMSSNLKRKLQTSIRNSLPQCNIKVILKSTNHLSSFFRFKDVIPKELRYHIVYKFSCNRCNATYYGKTERHLNIRSGEHIALYPLTENTVACKPPKDKYNIPVLNLSSKSLDLSSLKQSLHQSFVNKHKYAK